MVTLSSPRLSAVFHAYQPPVPIQSPKIIDRIVKNCYRPFFELLLENGDVQITLNINVSLSEYLNEHFSNVIDLITMCAEKGQIEFLASGAYHPLLPLIPEEECKFQIELNHKINQEIFGKKNYHPVGFFPPELATSKELFNLLLSFGFRYSLVSQPTLPILINSSIPFYSHNNQKLLLILRNKGLSNLLSFKRYPKPENFVEHLKTIERAVDAPVVMAMDIETFGEHHKGYAKFLFESFKHIKTIQLKKLVDKMPVYEVFKVNDSSWSTEPNQIQNGVPYPLWDDPQNPYHQLINLHQGLVLETIRLLEREETDVERKNRAHVELSKSLVSCTTWWASAHGRWSPGMIKKGIRSQRQSMEKALEMFQNIENRYILTGFLIQSSRIARRLERMILYR